MAKHVIYLLFLKKKKMQKPNFDLAKKCIDEGKVICFPTETVFGLGVAYDSFDAYTLLNKVKGRPEDKPYTMMMAKKEDIEKYAYIDDRAKKIIDAFMPGALTILVKAKENVPGYVTHNTGIIGIRIPDYKVVQDMIEYINKPLLVPSANKSGFAPALTKEDAINYFHDEVNFYLDGEVKQGKPSTIVDLSKDEIKVIRQGAIMEIDILNVIK